MPRNPEGRVQDKILQILRGIEGSFWLKPTDTNMVGTPDIIGDIRGIACYIEVKKSEKEKPSDVQQYRIRKATLRGAIAFVTHNWIHCLNELTERLQAKGVDLNISC